jgi:hypothetical protein
LQRSAAAQGGPDPSAFRASRGFLDMPWNEARGFDQFGYGPFSNQLNGHNISSETGAGSGPGSTGGNSTRPPTLLPHPASNDFEMPRANPYDGPSLVQMPLRMSETDRSVSQQPPPSASFDEVQRYRKEYDTSDP